MKKVYYNIIYVDQIMQNNITEVVYATALNVMLGIKVPSYNKIIFNYMTKVS